LQTKISKIASGDNHRPGLKFLEKPNLKKNNYIYKHKHGQETQLFASVSDDGLLQRNKMPA